MEWIVKIIGEKNQRIKVVFNPLGESITFYGEARVKNNEWTVFSIFKHKMIIELDQIQEMMTKAVSHMRTITSMRVSV